MKTIDTKIIKKLIENFWTLIKYYEIGTKKASHRKKIITNKTVTVFYYVDWIFANLIKYSISIKY